MSISKSDLILNYVQNGFSAKKIAGKFYISESQVNYWLSKYSIPKRSISQAIYLKHNPAGDPFKLVAIKKRDLFLFGLGIGLYWGEGNKKSLNSVRLGNSDPRLIMSFIKFMETIYSIDKSKLKFGIQVFSDVSSREALAYWSKYLKVSKNSFYKVTITPSRGVGTYRHKSKYGVLTVYFNNSKLQKIIKDTIENIQELY